MLFSIRAAADAVHEVPDQELPPEVPKLQIRTGSLAVALRAKRPEDDSQLQIRTGSLAVALHPERPEDLQLQLATGSLAVGLEVERPGVPLQVTTGSLGMTLVHTPTPGMNIMLPVGIDLDLAVTRSNSAMAIAVGPANLQLVHAPTPSTLQVRTGSLGMTLATAPQPPIAISVRTGSVRLQASFDNRLEIATGVEMRLSVERRLGSITMRTGGLNVNMTMEVGGSAFAFTRDLVISGDTGFSAGTMTNLVLLGIRLDSPDFRSAADGGRLRQPNAGDIEFVQIGTTPPVVLPHNVISHASNTTTGVIIFDLRLPTWDLHQDFRVRMNYGAGSNTPTNTTLPLITGPAVVNSVLTCDNGTWTGAPTITFARRWLRNGADITGATNSSYTTVTADVGTTITCRVTASNSFGSTQAVSSNGVNVVDPSETPAGWPYPQSTLYAKLNFNRALTRYGQTNDQFPCSVDSSNRVLFVGADGRGLQPGAVFADRREWRVSRVGSAIPLANGLPTNGQGLAGLTNLNMSMLDTIADPTATQPTPSKPQGVLAFGASNIACWYSFSITQATGFEAWRRRTYVATSTDDGTNFNLHRLLDDYLFRLNREDSPGDNFEDLIVWGVLQLDPGYAPGTSGVDDDYIYVYLTNSPQQDTHMWNSLHLNQTIWMARVRWKGGTPVATINNIWERSQYQMFTGLNPTTGVPTWGTGGAFGTKTPVFVDGNGMALFLNVGWHSAIGKFVATYIHCDDDANGILHQGIAVAIADTPWNRNGWTMIGYDQALDQDDVLEVDHYMSVMAPSRWNSGTDISVAVSTYVSDAEGGVDGYPGDNLIVSSAALTFTGSQFVEVAPLLGLTRPTAQILRPTDAQLRNNLPNNANQTSNHNFNLVPNFRTTNNATLDLRGKRFYHHSLTAWGTDATPAAVSALRPDAYQNGLVIYGAEIIGEQIDDTVWRDMKFQTPANPANMDDNDIDFQDGGVASSSTIYVEACVFRKSFDGVNTDNAAALDIPNKLHFIVRGCYAEKQRDEFIENDGLSYLEVYDCLVDSCHNFVSMRPSSGSPAVPPNYAVVANRVQCRNVLARCRGQYYTTDVDADRFPVGTKRVPQWEPGNSSVFVADPIAPTLAPITPGYVHREPWKGDNLETTTNLNATIWVDCRDCIFAFESLPTSNKVVFPPGTYSNVYLLYLPDLAPSGTFSTIAGFVNSTYVQDRGITVLAGAEARTMWNRERQNWITAHGGTVDANGLLQFPFHTAPS